MTTPQNPVNEHFKAAARQAEHLQFIYSKTVKHAQEQSILRSLLAGLRNK